MYKSSVVCVHVLVHVRVLRACVCVLCACVCVCVLCACVCVCAVRCVIVLCVAHAFDRSYALVYGERVSNFERVYLDQ